MAWNKCNPEQPQITFYLGTKDDKPIIGFRWKHEDGKSGSNRECTVTDGECDLAFLERKIVEAKYEAMYPDTFKYQLQALRDAEEQQGEVNVEGPGE